MHNFNIFVDTFHNKWLKSFENLNKLCECKHKKILSQRQIKYQIYLLNEIIIKTE